MHLPSLGLLSAFQSLRPVGCGHLQVQPIAFFIQHNLARAPKGDVPSDLYSLDSDAFRALAEKLVQEFSFPEAKEGTYLYSHVLTCFDCSRDHLSSLLPLAGSRWSSHVLCQFLLLLRTHALEGVFD